MPTSRALQPRRTSRTAGARLAGSTLILRDVAARPVHQLRIHHLEPQRRNHREPEAARIAARQARQVVEIAQRLIRPQRVGVMVRVTLQVERDQVRVDVVRVPGVARLGQLVAAVRQLLAQQAVVLDVVRLRQAVPRVEVMDDAGTAP